MKATVEYERQLLILLTALLYMPSQTVSVWFASIVFCK